MVRENQLTAAYSGPTLRYPGLFETTLRSQRAAAYREIQMTQIRTTLGRSTPGVRDATDTGTICWLATNPSSLICVGFLQ